MLDSRVRLPLLARVGARLGARAGVRVDAAAFAAVALCLAHLALWGGVFALTFPMPRLDGAEQLVWAYSAEGGYWKHPPLPSWIMYALVHTFGASAALTYVAGQACIAITLAIGWRLGREFMDGPRSLAGLALTSLVVFYNMGGDAFNHELALLPLVAATALLFLRAVRTGHARLWCLAGLAAGLALLAKYEAALHLLALGAWFIADRRRWTARNFAGIALAAAVALAVVAPHLLWLVRHDFLPVRYAQAVVQAHQDDRLAGMLEFLGVVAARALPLLIVAWLVLRRAPGDRPAAAPAGGTPDRSFLWMVGGLPLLLTVAFGFVTGTNPPARWGTTGLWLSGWLALDLWGGAMGSARLRRTLLAAAVTQLALGAVTIALPHVSAARHSPGRTNFPTVALAESVRATWAEQAHTPLRLVVSDTWIGGNLVAQWRGPPPAVLIEGDPRKAPWVPPDAVHRCGALVIVDFSRDGPADPEVQGALLAYLDQAGPHGEWDLPWPADVAARSAPPRTWIVWGVIPPQPGAVCPL